MPKIFTNETCAIATIYAFVDRHPEKAETMVQFARETYGVGELRRQPNWQPTMKCADALERRLHATFERTMGEVIRRILERAPPSNYGDRRITIGTYVSPQWGVTQYGIHDEEGLLFYTANANFHQHRQTPSDALGLLHPWVSATQYEWDLRQLLEKRLEDLVAEQLFA